MIDDHRPEPERSGQQMTLRVALGIARVEMSEGYKIGDDRVVGGEQLEIIRSDQVGAAIANVAELEGSLGLKQAERHRRAHSPQVWVPGDLPEELIVSCDDPLHDRSLGGSVLVGCGSERGRAGDIAGDGPTHPVRNANQDGVIGRTGGLRVYGVLVAPPHPSLVRCGRPDISHGS